MPIFRFSWCVCSFDQECNISAETEEAAKIIFEKEVIGDNKTWAANHATVFDLSTKYTQEWITQNVTIHFK